MTQTAVAVSTLTVLIVDDSAMMRSMLKRVTLNSGAPVGKVLEAGNGREALELLEREPVDALFTDLNMPEMNGADLLRAVKERREWDRMLRVVISTDGSTERRMEMSTLGVRCCVEKPFKPELVREVLSELIASR